MQSIEPTPGCQSQMRGAFWNSRKKETCSDEGSLFDLEKKQHILDEGSLFDLVKKNTYPR